MAEIKDLIKSIVEKNPVDFNDTFNTLMQEKAADAVLSYKEYIASNMYNVAESIEEDEEDNEDIDLEDEDFEDIDLDDIDFEDIDLDGDEDESEA